MIYLGSLTQFYVDTKLGPVVSYRMNDEPQPGVESGPVEVVLTWPVHGSSVLAEPHSLD